MDATPDSVYQLIKSFEGQFTPPAPYFTINVGTLDVDTGAFSGLTTHSETDPEPIEHGPHQTPKNPPPRFVGETYVTVSISASWRQTVTVSPAPKVPLQPVLLVFSISHPIADPWSISANGVTLTAQPGQTSLQADVWDAQFANWSVQAGSASFTDTIRFQRPGSVPAGAAAGAFTIPILPVTIVYAPPADSTLKSTSNYVQGQTVGTTNTFDTSTDTSQTSPVASAEVVAMATLKQGLDTASKILSLGGGEEKAVGIVLSSISQQLGTISSTGTSGTFDDSQNQITVIESTTDALTASVINGGPGSGDIFCFYHNLQMVWMYFDGKLRLTPLNYRKAIFPAKALQQQQAAIGVSAEDAAAVLALDPFVAGGSGADLPGDRYEFRTSLDYGYGGCYHYVDSVTRDTKTQTTHTSYDTKTNEWDLGPILKGFGLGEKDVTTVKVTNATGTDVSNTITLDANLESGQNDHFITNIWFDRLFGAFAFQTEQPAVTARLRGQGAQPFQEVRLTAGGKVFSTLADQHGAYAFFARSIPAGQAMLAIGDQPGKSVAVNAM